ncbi:hypothetical protein OsI_03630 [Oryza sativa Indica Group]|uniref:Uncharacterized protein n=2 Tax=Oryza sativa TaxID=4530 RepID=A2ZXI7_ORYSJ|nr:hypothetical protein OsI_03630 [Oryza sativa Indica Group]EAZ13434.1 hypothetical protein OsJ_03353 [Oryza sativa Japonica Group]
MGAKFLSGDNLSKLVQVLRRHETVLQKQMVVDCSHTIQPPLDMEIELPGLK